MKTSYVNFIKIAAFIIGAFLISTSVCKANVGESPALKLNDMAIESELVIEDWMVDLSEWSGSETMGTSEGFDAETDMEIEGWMLNIDNWSSEEEIEMEDWMTNLEKW